MTNFLYLHLFYTFINTFSAIHTYVNTEKPCIGICIDVCMYKRMYIHIQFLSSFATRGTVFSKRKKPFQYKVLTEHSRTVKHRESSVKSVLNWVTPIFCYPNPNVRGYLQRENITLHKHRNIIKLLLKSMYNL